MNDELYHHGILGMRWGIRRTKSQLGYKTGNGKKRQGDDSDAEAKAASSGKSGGSKKSVTNMTDDELRNHINRLQMERQYLDLERQISAYTPQQISRGKKFMKSMEKDVITPALKDAGKNLLTKFLNKKGAELLGLDEKKTKDSMEELKKEVMGLNLKKQKIELNKYFDEQNAKSKSDSKKTSESDSSEKSSKSESSSKESFSEKVKSKSEKDVSTGSYKDDSSNREGSSSKTESSNNEEKVYTGKVYGEGTSKYNPDSHKNNTVIDADFSEVTVSSVVNSNNRQIGQNYIAALLEDKRKR